MARQKRVVVGQAYGAVRVRDFSGGLRTGHPTAIPDDALATATNVVLTLEGKVKPRGGVRKRFRQDFDSSPVVGVAPYYKADGTTRLVIAAGTTLYVDKPHLTFFYDSQADWEQADAYTNLDTKSAPGDVKMYTPPQATFLGTATFGKVWV